MAKDFTTSLRWLYGLITATSRLIAAFCAVIMCGILLLARTIIDAAYNYKRFTSLPDAYDWIREKADKANPRLVNKIYKKLEGTSSL